MRRTQFKIQARRKALARAGLMVLAAVTSEAVRAAEPAKMSPEAEARAIESRLIDLQVQAGVLRSLQANAQPVDTGILAERLTTPVVAGQQDTGQIAQIDGEIEHLSSRYRKIYGRGAGILPNGAHARQPAAGTMIARAPELMTAPDVAASPGAEAAPAAQGGWSSTTTVSPGHERGVDSAYRDGGGGWGSPSDGNGQDGFRGQAPQNSFAGGGDATGGRVGEVLPPGVPYPGTENGRHGQALAGLDQARQPAGRQAQSGSINGNAGDDPDAAYEKAYGYLLEQDYGAAEFAFRDFLKRYSRNPLAGNAQYWLGEIHYVQGKYREAARAFLTGYEQYGDGHKAADSLFKLALSLDKLNQPQAACSSLSEFFKRYGSAVEAPVEQASQVRQQLRCRS